MAAKLGNRRYLDKDPVTFFTAAYSVRSRLIHAHAADYPSWEVVNDYAGWLELFVAHLLADEPPPAEPPA